MPGLGIGISPILKQSKRIPGRFISSNIFNAAENQNVVGTALALPLGGAYSIKAGGDGALFTINGSTGALTGNSNFNYEVKSSYSLTIIYTVLAKDFEQSISVNITNVNEVPTDITLSASSVGENNIIGTVVGALSTTDVDVGDTFTYSLVSGTGSTDNASFAISGSNLVTNAVFDYETKSSYSVRIRTTDAGGLYFEKAFTITVTEGFILPLTTTGTGAGVSTLGLTVSADSIITLTGNAYFYDDAAGTTNANQSRTITSGATSTFYLKVLSGSSNLTTEKLKVTQLNTWDSSTNAASINAFDIANIPANMTVFFDNYIIGVSVYVIGNNTITGNLSSLRSNLTSFNVGVGTNSITGNLSSLPTGLTSFNCGTGNTITGNLSSLPSGLTFIRVSGSNTISGDLSSIASLPLTVLNFQGSNTIAGNLSSLPSSLLLILVLGSNTITGNLSSLSSMNLLAFQIVGNNTITGNLNGLPLTLNQLQIGGSNTVSGNLSSLSSLLIYINFYGNNTISDYTSGKTWNNNINFFRITPVAGGGLSSTEVDNLIIDLNGSAWAGTSRTLSLIGTNAARTAASNAAVTSLTTNKSVTVTTTA